MIKSVLIFEDEVESGFHELTGFGFLDFWMQSIYAYAITNEQIPDESRPQLSPPIFIVGTHRESADISPDPQQRRRTVSTMLYLSNRKYNFFTVPFTKYSIILRKY